MLAYDYEKSFSYQFFSAYFQKLIRLKQRALSELGPQISPPKKSEMINTIEDIVREFEIMIREYEQRFLQINSYTYSSFRETLYAVVALTDEVFLKMQWYGVDYWKSNILESRLFKTRSAGDKVFEEMDIFLSTPNVLKADLAAVYLSILSFGFSGKFGSTSHLEIKQYKTRFYELIFQQKLMYLEGESQHLIPQHDLRTVTPPSRVDLPDPYAWYNYYFMGIIVFLLVSYFAWFDSTYEIRNLLSSLSKIGG
jgi:type VI secretion system protein ImpK